MKWAAACAFKNRQHFCSDRSVARIRELKDYRALTLGSRPRLYACTCSQVFCAEPTAPNQFAPALIS